MIFKIGDRVIYTGKSARLSDKSRIGDVGTVIGIPSHVNIRISWDEKDVAGHYPENLDYYSVDVGDLEDDI